MEGHSRHVSIRCYRSALLSYPARPPELKAAGGALVVVDYYADWCGPCKQMAPVVEAAAAANPAVMFLKTNADSSDAASARGVKALPTFHFFLKGALVHEMKGADAGSFKAAVAKYAAQATPAAASAFSGAGVKMGGSAGTPEEMRAARLAKYAAAPSTTDGAGAGSASGGSAGATTAAAVAAAPSPAPKAAAAAPVAAALAPRAHAYVLASAPVPAPVPAAPTVALIDPETTLTDAMGFSRKRARAALEATGGGSLDAAVEWLAEHEEDVEMEGVASTAAAAATSASTTSSAAPADPNAISAEDLAAIASAEDELNATNISEGGAGGKKMTVEEVKAFLATRRVEKAAAEKVGEECVCVPGSWSVGMRGTLALRRAWVLLIDLFIFCAYNPVLQEAERLREIKRREDGRKNVDLAESLAAAAVRQA